MMHNATYLHSDSQNEMIGIHGKKIIQGNLLLEVCKVKFHAVMAD